MARAHDFPSGRSGDGSRIRLLEEDIQRGDYETAVQRAESATATDPRGAVIVARARVRQGRVHDALAVLNAVRDDDASPGMRLRLDVQHAATLVLRTLDFQAALDAADRAFENIHSQQIPPGDRAEAELLRCQIVCMARVYYEIDVTTHAKALDRLIELAATLEAEGRLDASWHARQLHASGMRRKARSSIRLADVAEEAGECGLWHRAGEMHLARAHRLIQVGAPTEDIEHALDAADRAFAAAHHVHGPIDVRLARTIFAETRGMAPENHEEEAFTSVYTSIRDAYREIDYPRGELDVLNRLSQRAHAQSRTSDADGLREEILRLVETMGLAPDASILALIDLQMRSQSFGGAIELSEAAVSQVRTRFVQSSYRQLLASTHLSSGRTDKAVQEARRAYEGFIALGADPAASDAAHTLADALMRRGGDQESDEAVDLLDQWKLQDQERGDTARSAWHAEQKAGVHVQRYHRVQSLSRSEAAVKAAAELKAAEAEAEYVKRTFSVLSEPSRSQREGGYWQTRTQIAIARGHVEGAATYSQRAFEVFERSGIGFEAANSLYLSGLFELNAANRQLEPHFGKAETRLTGALNRYEEMGMRQQVADTLSKLGLLYVNAAFRFPSDATISLREQLIAAALDHLREADAVYDAIRREFDVGDPQDRHQTKRALAEGRHEVYPLALQATTLLMQSAGETWAWVQRMKARTLSDGIALAGSPTRRIVDRVSDPEALKYIEEEIELATRLIECPAADRWTLRAEQKELHRRMVEHPDLQLYLQVRTGGVFPEELLSEFLAFPLAEGQSCVCVDWFELDGRYWLVTRSFGASSGYALQPTSVSVDAVTQLLQRIRTRGAHRDFYRFFADELRSFDPLVEPLHDLAQPEDLLVFVPTGHLHRLPLHALQVNGKAVLERHPVVYTPSLTALGHCMARAQAPKLQTAAILANPTEDVPGADPIAHDLRSHLDADLYTGRAVTRNRLLQAIRNVDLVHFHGHASFDAADPLESRLHVHDGAVRARDVFDVPGLQASLVTLAACETGTQDIDAGDEPLGLIPAFLTAGAGSVLATLWPVAATPTQAVIESFYNEVMRKDIALGTRSPLNRAEALRAAVLRVRETPGWEAPYYWAAFTLHGDWRSVGTSVV